MFKYRKLWGVYIGQFAVTTCQWFFLTWFPTYLISYRHLSVPKTPLYVALPFVAAFVGVQLSGFVSDRILRSGGSLGLARKTPIIVGLLLSASIIGANFVDAPEAVIAFMALAFFGNGMASHRLVADQPCGAASPDRADRRHLQLHLQPVRHRHAPGVRLSGAARPLSRLGFVYVASIAVMGALAYILVIGKLERVE